MCCARWATVPGFILDEWPATLASGRGQCPRFIGRPEPFPLCCALHSTHGQPGRLSALNAAPPARLPVPTSRGAGIASPTAGPLGLGQADPQRRRGLLASPLWLPLFSCVPAGAGAHKKAAAARLAPRLGVAPLRDLAHVQSLRADGLPLRTDWHCQTVPRSCRTGCVFPPI